jgi:hypothetical protein
MLFKPCHKRQMFPIFTMQRAGHVKILIGLDWKAQDLLMMA